MSNELVIKISKASKEVGGKLNPDKTNAEQKYDYISGDKIISVCGQALANNGVMVIPSVEEDETTLYEYTDQWDKKKRRYDSRVKFSFLVTDGDTERTTSWFGRGSDYVTPDKALYKAITSGHKYFLMKLLFVGAGNEDGEHENPPEEEHKTYQKQPVSHNTPEPQQRNSARPYKPEGVVAGITHFVDLYTEKPNDKYKETWRTGIASNIEKEVSEYANNKQEVRQAILQYLVGKEHVDQLTVPEVSAIWRWLGVNKRDENGNVVKDGGAWSLDPNTEKEIKAIYDKLNGSGEENIVDAEVDERGDAPD